MTPKPKFHMISKPKFHEEYSKWLIIGGKSILHTLFSRFNMGIAHYTNEFDSISLIRRLKKKGMLLSILEAEQLYSLVRATSHLNGAMAEFGVYRGASAKLIIEAEWNKVNINSRKLYLYDTFEGLPETSSLDVVPGMGRFHSGMFKSSVKATLEFLYKEQPTIPLGVNLRSGFFPESAKSESALKFSFVHLDCDLHESTLAGMQFFLPRMVSGGIILCHDYKTCPGVKLAMDVFMSGEVESVIPLSGNQCMIVKQ